MALHRLDIAEAIERPDDEEGIPEPAIAIVPVAPRAGGLGQRRRRRGDNRPGLLERAELERDRRPDHRVLPLEGDVQPAGEVAPVGRGALVEVARRLVEAAAQAVVGAEMEDDRLVDLKTGLVEHIGQWCVGGQPERHHVVDIANVIAAAGDHLQLLAVVVQWPAAHPDGRAFAERLDDADQRRRMEHSAEELEARREVGDSDAAAAAVAHHRLEQCGILDIVLLDAHPVLELDAEEAAVAIIVEQPAEHRIAVEAGKAAPDDPRLAVDQSRDRAIADKPEGHHGPSTLHDRAGITGSSAAPRAAAWPVHPLPSPSRAPFQKLDVVERVVAKG